ncbi:MAG TPA: class I mannose-6-phosphate isomerase [Terracidiphilus sp.]|nr:class I mannose-6-phosphate isomerase [Terracidiphilus sp.]
MYDKSPYLRVSGDETGCRLGWGEIGAAIRQRLIRRRTTVCVECYPGTFIPRLQQSLSTELSPDHLLLADSCYLSCAEIESKFNEFLTDDPVFGRMNPATIDDFLDPSKIAEARGRLVRDGLNLVIGTGASLIAEDSDVLVYADLARWEIQQRYRRGEIGNLGIHNPDEKPFLKYKRGFFLDWRAADRLKMKLLPRADFLLDCNRPDAPAMIAGADLHRALDAAVQQPFRLVPFFDPGPWGGHWMETVCDLPSDKPNYAWCFDCVPEENSLLFGFGRRRIEIPALDLVLMRPRSLLGAHVESLFGAEFPIRFDFLDTMGGGNLSLQVHPRSAYIRERFGMPYTQDESYYLLDAGDDGCVYLGLRESADPDAMIRELKNAASSSTPVFHAEEFVNRFPVRKHDHILIPAGTVHCSGRNCMVLEISATPYIFTFKLWDWARMDLDGHPRPLHIQHGAANICRERRTRWVQDELINRVEFIASGPHSREERTGLHPLEFIETRRHWFTGSVDHDTHDTVNVLNLVQGRCAVVESPNNAFDPFEVHYAETFIVPAAVGRYTIRPQDSGATVERATIKAFIRPDCVALESTK